MFVGACAGSPTTASCETVIEPERTTVVRSEPIAIDEEQIVYDRWLARGDAHDFKWLEWRIHVRLDQSPRDLARWAELARLHIDRAVRDEDPSALAQVGLLLADADRIGGDSAELELVRGLLAQLEGRHDDAVAAWQRAVDLDPTFAEARLRLGIACLEHSDFARAGEQLSAYVELEPDDAEGWLALGVAHAHTGERESARKAYLYAAKLAPEDPRPHWNLAWMSQDLAWVEEYWQVEEELHRSREHLRDLFETIRAHPLPDCEAVFFPDPQCLAAIEQREQLEIWATELDTTNSDAVAAFRYDAAATRTPHGGARELEERAKKAEEERRRQLLEMEKAAEAAGQPSPSELAEE
jgi:Flp pilus assembly protein TadD